MKFAKFSEIQGSLDLAGVVQSFEQEAQLVLAVFLLNELLVPLELGNVVVRHFDPNAAELSLVNAKLLDGFLDLEIELLLL